MSQGPGRAKAYRPDASRIPSMSAVPQWQAQRYDQSSVLMRHHTCLPCGNSATPQSSARESMRASPRPLSGTISYPSSSDQLNFGRTDALEW